TLDFKTFIESTGLDYAKDAYVSHPSPEVLGGNYSSTEQVKSIQRLFAYCLLTGIKVDETQSTRLRCQTLTKNKGKTSYEVEPDHETLQLTTLADIQAYLLSEDELGQESDKEEVFAAGDDMEEDTQANEEEHKSPSPNKDKTEPSDTPETQVSDSDSSSSNLKKYENILSLTESQLVKNVDHKEQSDKVIDAAMNSLDKNSIARGDLLNALNGVTDTHKAIQDAVKEDHSSVESLQANALSQEKHLAEWAKSSTSMAWNLGLRLTAIENS
ncbi:hypothetical protein Tco_1453181, partial [Tanacetum coccineum]